VVPDVSTPFQISLLPINQARTEALYGGIEKKRVSAYGIEAYGTLMAHPLGLETMYCDIPVHRTRSGLVCPVSTKSSSPASDSSG
jgi:hypothetical protein